MKSQPLKKSVLAGQFAFFALCAVIFCITLSLLADTNLPPATGASTNRAALPTRRLPVKQAAVASTNAVFGAISTNDAVYKAALEAHALDDAKKLIGTNGTFKGTVVKLFEPGGMTILEFDNDYKTALTALVRSTNFSSFPVLTNLIGSNVMVTGPFIDYRGKAEMILEKPEQIKLVK
jgi:DNA/RNA endonuclease YhcR with UshA esterase domain